MGGLFAGLPLFFLKNANAMKSLKYFFTIGIFVVSFHLSAQVNNTKDTTITTFKVFGNCEMCKERIEIYRRKTLLRI